LHEENKSEKNVGATIRQQTSDSSVVSRFPPGLADLVITKALNRFIFLDFTNVYPLYSIADMLPYVIIFAFRYEYITCFITSLRRYCNQTCLFGDCLVGRLVGSFVRSLCSLWFIEKYKADFIKFGSHNAVNTEYVFLSLWS